MVANAAHLALAGYGAFLVLAFGLRSFVHYRRTGRSGFVGLSGTSGSIEWCGGVLFALAILGGAAAPLLQLTGHTVPLLPEGNAAATSAGVTLLAIGITATLWAQFAMGKSWRIGVDRRQPTALVASGPFIWVRNPIYTSMLVATLGIVLLVPNPWALATFAALALALELQVRCVEEPWLLASHGGAYQAYAARTGRFVPGIGYLRSAAVITRVTP